MNKNLLVLLTITILSGIALSSTIVSADNTEVIDTVELIVPVACTMSGTGTTHTATLNPGTYSGASGSEYENGIGKTTLTAICNDDNGFSIYAIGYTGDEYGVTNLIGSNTNGTIATKAYASGDTTSNWSMKLTKVDNPSTGDPVTYNPENLTITTNYDNWIAVPATYTKVAQYKANTGSSTTDTTLGVKLETTYAAYIASNQAADTYVGQVKYTMVHPYTEEAPFVCRPSGTTISTIKCMQDISPTNKSTILASMTEGQQYTLVDNRDNKTYFIAKQADNNIWMTQNLDLCIGCEGVAALTSENTDLNISGSEAYINGYSNQDGLITWTPSDTAITSGRIVSGDSVNEWARSSYPYSAEGGDMFVYTSGNNGDDIIYNSETDCDIAHNDGSCPHYHIGNYYNWSAAIAVNDYAGYYVAGSIASNSICPSGWRLPGKNDNLQPTMNDYSQLFYSSGIATSNSLFSTFTQNGFNGIRSAPLYYVRGGFIEPIFVEHKRTDGYYHLNTYGSQNYMVFSVGNLYNNREDYDFYTNYNGMSIRCLVR